MAAGFDPRKGRPGLGSDREKAKAKTRVDDAAKPVRDAIALNRLPATISGKRAASRSKKSTPQRSSARGK